ncbi:SCO family protein [Leptospira ognonensis]|uniref:SCO family protein n=1 Tax=Leptospira ognonensis TaxID=2484945 RepID=A0A4R9K402_9LEPT|nr:SCO family protein [Leptospira ognonensis]TGL60166.1 SCO family protein [Leptospira ognonensis]
MYLKRLTFSLILIIPFFCSEQKPNFDAGLTFASTPIAGVLPYYKGEIMDPFWSPEGQKPADLKKIPEISLTSHLNAPFNRNMFLGKYSLVTFFYAKCTGICPLITRNIKNFFPSIKNQPLVQVLSISVNPEVDTVEELLKFRKVYKIEQKNWLHLTGSKALIYDLARNQFNADVQVIKGIANLNDFVHTENIYLIDPNGYLRGVYRAKGTGDLDRLLAEMETLRNEEGTKEHVK